MMQEGGSWSKERGPSSTLSGSVIIGHPRGASFRFPEHLLAIEARGEKRMALGKKKCCLALIFRRHSGLGDFTGDLAGRGAAGETSAEIRRASELAIFLEGGRKAEGGRRKGEKKRQRQALLQEGNLPHIIFSICRKLSPFYFPFIVPKPTPYPHPQGDASMHSLSINTASRFKMAPCSVADNTSGMPAALHPVVFRARARG